MLESERLPSCNIPAYAKTETIFNSEGTYHNKIICYTGVTASGKDFLLESVLGSLDPQNRIRTLNMGTLMSTQLGMHRDHLKNALSLQEINDNQLAILPYILNATPVILNTHMIAQYHGMLLINPHFESTLNPDQYIVVASDPEQIRSWRTNRNISGNRLSEVEDINTIDLHQQIVINSVTAIAKHLGSSLSIIHNIPAQTERNVEFLKELLTNFMKF